MRYRSSALAAVLALVAPAAAAQNLVTNAHFETNVDFWTIYYPGGGATIAWSPLDWAGNPSSGSALVTNTMPDAGYGRGFVSACIVVPGAGPWEYGAHIRIPGGQSTTGYARVSQVWTMWPGCTFFPGHISYPGTSVTTATTDVWVPILVPGPQPSAGQNLQVIIEVFKDQAGGTLSAHFDFVRFGLQGTTPVEPFTFVVE